MGSTMATTCTDVAAAISAKLLRWRQKQMEVTTRFKCLHAVFSTRWLCVSVITAHYAPLSLGPQQVGSQHDGDVARGHLVGLAVLSQLGQKLHQVPA